MDDDRPDRAALAISLSLLALALFAAMGLVIKHLSPFYSAAELSAYRNLFGLIPSLVVLVTSSGWHERGRIWRLRQWKLAGFRGFCVACAQFLYYISLANIAFATATTITYANSLFMTALAIPLLGERVGAIRWIAVLIGFLGVMMIMKPGADSFSIYSLAPLGAAFGYALVGVLARWFDADAPSPLINLYTSATAAVAAFVLAMVLGGFSPILDLGQLGWIMAMGGFGGTATLLLVISFRMTEQSNIAPFNYFGIPMAFFFGWMFFDEAPVSDLFPGALLIVGGGLMVIWRERRIRRQTTTSIRS
ncbi:DMT family transporter [Falsiphaeobacter marinintestinus]|uniref:DMT family transporter n=1 Tax=Falsiphaeobacter marinintestinus TaxID=1492905 RepID=UPI0011B62B30|nr:DMT family transporter [Phaeobacter marinintestinus]